jgi:hypothetical protein
MHGKPSDALLFSLQAVPEEEEELEELEVEGVL